VELRFFAGLSIEETSTVLDISPDTVKRELDHGSHVAVSRDFEARRALKAPRSGQWRVKPLKSQSEMTPNLEHVARSCIRRLSKQEPSAEAHISIQACASDGELRSQVEALMATVKVQSRALPQAYSPAGCYMPAQKSMSLKSSRSSARGHGRVSSRAGYAAAQRCRD